MAGVTPPNSNFPAIVELNVGGVFYSTSISTLTSEPGSKLAKTFGSEASPETVLKDSKVSNLFKWYNQCTYSFQFSMESAIIMKILSQCSITSKCGNYWNLLSHFLDKNFVKATRFLKLQELISRNFFLVRVNFLFFHTVYIIPFCCMTNFSHSHTMHIENFVR